MSLLSLFITAGCGKGPTPTQVVDVPLTTSASAPAPTASTAPVQTSEGAAAPPLPRSRLAGPAKEVFVRRGAIVARDEDGKEEELVREDPSVVVGNYELREIRNPEFSVDGKRVFFSVVNGRNVVVLAIDLVTKKITAVTGGWDYRILRRGPHSGQILLLKRQYPPPPNGGLQPACSIVDSVNGRLIRPIDCMATGAQLGVEIY